MVLAKIYLDYGEGLEWDMFHYWHMDINDESLTLRRLWNFFQRLPHDSETKQDFAGVQREAREWNVNTWMLANIADILMAIDWHTISAYSKQTPPKPKAIPRPTMFQREKKKAVWPGKTIVVPKET
jgi:hypothetical protein